MYREIVPDNQLKEYIQTYWIYEGSKHDNLLNLNPDGCFDILIYFYERRENEIFITGICDKSIKVNLEKGVDMFGIRFYPNALDCFFDTSISEIKNQKISFEKLMFKYDVTGDIIFKSRNIDKILDFFNEYFLYALQFKFDNVISDFMHNIDGDVRVEDIANNIGVSTRHLTRILSGKFGINTKTYISITRFIKAKNMLENKYDYNSIVHECGYYDQSHFIKEFKKYAGELPSEF